MKINGPQLTREGTKRRTTWGRRPQPCGSFISSWKLPGDRHHRQRPVTTGERESSQQHQGMGRPGGRCRPSPGPRLSRPKLELKRRCKEAGGPGGKARLARSSPSGGPATLARLEKVQIAKPHNVRSEKGANSCSQVRGKKVNVSPEHGLGSTPPPQMQQCGGGWPGPPGRGVSQKHQRAMARVHLEKQLAGDRQSLGTASHPAPVTQLPRDKVSLSVPSVPAGSGDSLKDSTSPKPLTRVPERQRGPGEILTRV